MDAIVANENKGQGPSTSIDEIKELNNAILSMDMDPSTANEQNYSQFYHVPESVKSKVVGNMGIEVPKQVNPILLSLFGNMMNLTKNHLAASCK
jgi:hypothetical protein